MWDLRDGVASVVGEVPCEYLYVDGRSVGEVTESDLKDRRILGEEGFVSIVTVIDRATKRVVTGPDIHARGIAEDDSVFDEIVPKITAALEDALHRAPEKVHTAAAAADCAPHHRCLDFSPSAPQAHDCSRGC